jgi:FlaA1/EpsC-like NDP-sugar epimerase/lipopolysaccharide/colanic/teichoic acid biosynthesis glycosyltransferase
MKQCIDFILALVGILSTLPFLPLIALIIKLDSKGTVFYCCDRIGKDGKLFKMYKFRTMYEMRGPIGDSVSPQGDPRVTPFGRILRRSKLNELPQLFNILKGEMSFVGPRPEAPNLAALYPPHAREIFTVKPGLVGPNQILGRNEEEWYPEGVAPQQYYIEAILPQKLPTDLAYVREASVLKDLHYIILGIRETIFKAICWQRVLQNKSRLFLLGADFMLSMLSFGLALALRFESFADHHALGDFLQLLPVVVLIRVSCFFYAGLYSSLIRYFSFADILAVFQGVSIGSILLVLLGFTPSVSLRTLSPSALLIDWLGLLVFMLSVRIALRFFHERHVRQPRQAEPTRRVLIFGAGDAGALACQFLMASKTAMHDVVGFLDDDATKRYKTLYGKRVLGNRFNLETLAKLYQVHEVWLALPSAPAQELAAIMQACRCAGVPYRIFSTPQEEKRSLPFGELFETRDLPADATALRHIFADKRVLIAGASGAFSMELCRQILSFAPQRLIILERYETYLTELVTRLQQMSPSACITPILCSPVDNGPIKDVFLDYRPHIVFHNAMRKYPPFLPFQSESIIRANYLATFTLAQHAAATGCSHFVLVSSEEADNRGNLIADSLRTVEIGLRQFFATHATRLSVTRLCDILENRDGVIRRLEEQIRNRETIVLPHREVQCWVLAVQPAVHFLLDTLVQLDRLGLKDGIFVCPYASSLRLLEVIQKLAALNGLQVDVDFTVRFQCEPPDPPTGAGRALVTALQDALVMTENPGIRLLKQPALSTSQKVAQAVQELLNFDEQDLRNDRWERLTRTLLCPESPL